MFQDAPPRSWDRTQPKGGEKKCSRITDGDNHLSFSIIVVFLFLHLKQVGDFVLLDTQGGRGRAGKQGCLGLQWREGRILLKLAREEWETLPQPGQGPTLTKLLESQGQHRNHRTTSSAGAGTGNISMVTDGHCWCPVTEDTPWKFWQGLRMYGLCLKPGAGCSPHGWHWPSGLSNGLGVWILI